MIDAWHGLTIHIFFIAKHHAIVRIGLHLHEIPHANHMYGRMSPLSKPRHDIAQNHREIGNNCPKQTNPVPPGFTVILQLSIISGLRIVPQGNNALFGPSLPPLEQERTTFDKEN